MSTFRAFVAVPVPAAIRQQLAATGRQLAQRLPGRAVRWVRPDGMHLTLRFLGDTDEEKVPALAAALEELAGRHAPFSLSLGKLGCFPNPRRPRVLWAGLEGNVPQLLALQAALDRRLQPHGWEPESRPFQAHLTLGRVRESAPAFARLPWGEALPPLPFPVEAVQLVQSVLRPGGAVYTVRHAARLRG